NPGADTTNAPLVWNPPEADCSYHNDWFHKTTATPKGYAFLKQHYLNTVGKSALFNLNVPPNTSGRIDVADSITLTQFGKWLSDTAFKYDWSRAATASASNTRKANPAYGAANAVDTSQDSYWAVDSQLTTGSLKIGLPQKTIVNMVSVQEYIPL